MDLAHIMAERATCSRLHVGAVIARDGRPLVSGYNGAPKGMPHCEHPSPDDEGTGCKVSVHAEANAVAFAARWGIHVEGATLFTTHSPCLYCAQLLINCGLARVVYGCEYRDPAGLNLLVSAGLEVVDWRNGMRYHYDDADDPLLQ